MNTLMLIVILKPEQTIFEFAERADLIGRHHLPPWKSAK